MDNLAINEQAYQHLIHHDQLAEVHAKLIGELNEKLEKKKMLKVNPLLAKNYENISFALYKSEMEEMTLVSYVIVQDNLIILGEWTQVDYNTNINNVSD